MGRSDVVFCEPWESANWWQRGYLRTASTTQPVAAQASDVSRTSIVTDGCISGSCLKVEMRQYESGALAIHWPLKAANLSPDGVYLRYYIKLGSNFNPRLCAADGSGAGSGGKFPGLADVDAYPDSQCGNGGARADGINCWSMRMKFRDCKAGETTVRHACALPSATTRFGGYVYYPTSSQEFANWDDVSWGAGYTAGPCSSDPTSIGNCGIASGGQFENGRWYLVETYVKMNTPGQADGLMQGWVDGVLSYDKRNMIWRKPGHDNLHVRTVWLNVHAGGEFVGLCQGSEIYLDQMVVATGQQIGAWRAP